MEIYGCHLNCEYYINVNDNAFPLWIPFFFLLLFFAAFYLEGGNRQSNQSTRRKIKRFNEEMPMPNIKSKSRPKYSLLSMVDLWFIVFRFALPGYVIFIRWFLSMLLLCGSTQRTANSREWIWYFNTLHNICEIFSFFSAYFKYSYIFEH